MKKIAIIFSTFLMVVTVTAFADVPVVDLSRNVGGDADVATVKDDGAVSTPASVAQTMSVAAPTKQVNSSSLEERLARLEQQVNNLVQMNLPKRLDDLEQQVQKLSGQVDVNTHNIQSLKDQLRDFYRDLEQRLNQVKTSATVASNATVAGVVGAASATALPANHDGALNAAASNVVTSDIAQSEPKEQKAYEHAFNLLQQKKYQQAISELNSYIKTYPKGTYIVNAHYWLGEVYYLLADLKKSGTEFQLIVDTYPQSVKVPDALLKIAMIHNASGKKEQAKKEFLEIKTRYPGSSAAKLAEEQLK